jgi:polyphosphate kinase
MGKPSDTVSGRWYFQRHIAAREELLKASHNRHAPWTLVDFKDQKRGRLTLIRDLLGRLPDTAIDTPGLDLTPLPGPLASEEFGALKPIAPFKV